VLAIAGFKPQDGKPKGSRVLLQRTQYRSREPATATAALNEHSSDLSGLSVDWPQGPARHRSASHEANEIDTSVWRWCVGWPGAVGLVKVRIQLTGFDRCLTQKRKRRAPLRIHLLDDKLWWHSWGLALKSAAREARRLH
jgi:hypothetical protein